MSMMSYEGFSARIEYDNDDRLFVGHIAGINDIVGFHADSVDALEIAFRASVDDYLETCRSAGKAPERAFSGKVMLRIDPKVHAQASLAAQITGQSLNQFASAALQEAAQRVS